MAIRTYRADGTIEVCRFVKPDGTNDFEVIQAAADEDTLLGISQEGSYDTPGLTGSANDAARDGHLLKVYETDEDCLLEIGSGGCSPGARLTSDANGAGIAVSADADHCIGAIALETGLEGELVRVRVVCVPVKTS